jgi:hypothetical protein
MYAVYTSNRGEILVSTPFSQPGRWNIFARELEYVLSTRGLRITQLDDRGVVRHREKVRRLQNSLTSPKHLTTLNPAEMELLVGAMQLTDDEHKRLLAALLATAVEMTLMDRVAADVALTAADNVFAILFNAMKAQPSLFDTTQIKAGNMRDNEETFGDAVFTEALDLIDRATLSLHASRNATTSQSRTTYAHEALTGFTRTLELLNQSRSPQHGSEGWQCWYDEAVEGQQMAQKLVQTGQES